MSTIKHVVFDIGQVLLHWDPEAPYRTLIPDEQERRWFLNEVCTPDWNREQDRGRSWEEAEALLIRDFPEQEARIRAYRRDWLHMLTHRIEGSLDLMNQVMAAGWDVTLLTNWNQDTFREAGAIHAFLSSTRGVTVSGEVGLIKPDPAIYQLHAQRFGLEPSATLFFDDSPNNVKGAQACGWVAELFVTPDKLKADLQKHGIL